MEEVPVSPASPEKAMMVWLFRERVLSSEALRMVAPRMAALEAAMRVKSLPVRPRRTSMVAMRDQEDLGDVGAWSWSLS